MLPTSHSLIVHTFYNPPPFDSCMSGMEEWPGRQMHSHNYRTAEPFAGKVVMSHD